jgi:hypothetical protein
MNIKRLSILMGCGAAALAIGVGVYRNGARAPKPAAVETEEASRDDDGVSRTAADQALQQRLRAMEIRLADMQDRANKRADPPSPAAEEPKARAPLTPEAGKALVEARLRQFDEAMRRETIDPRWAQDSERMLAAAFSEGGFKGTKVISSECKATMCRMEAVHDDNESLTAFEEIRYRQPMTYYIQPVDDADGKRKTVAYFIRQGHDREENHVFAKMWVSR